MKGVLAAGRLENGEIFYEPRFLRDIFQALGRAFFERQGVWPRTNKDTVWRALDAFREATCDSIEYPGSTPSDASVLIEFHMLFVRAFILAARVDDRPDEAVLTPTAGRYLQVKYETPMLPGGPSATFSSIFEQIFTTEEKVWFGRNLPRAGTQLLQISEWFRKVFCVFHATVAFYLDIAVDSPPPIELTRAHFSDVVRGWTDAAMERGGECSANEDFGRIEDFLFEHAIFLKALRFAHLSDGAQWVD